MEKPATRCLQGKSTAGNRSLDPIVSQFERPGIGQKSNRKYSPPKPFEQPASAEFTLQSNSGMSRLAPTAGKFGKPELVAE